MDFTLQPWHPDYAPALARYANNKRIADNLRDGFPHPYTPEDAESFIKSCMEAPAEAQYLRAIVAKGEACGSIGVFFTTTGVYRRSAELGYWLAEPYWGQGIITEAIRQICANVFDQFPHIARIYAEPYARNAGSRRVLEKAGFTLEGILRDSVTKNNILQDGCMYALLRGEFEEARV